MLIPNHQAFSIGGGRVATIILYLSDDIVGGKTIFPALDVGIVPEAGSILLFSTKVIMHLIFNKYLVTRQLGFKFMF